MRISLVLVSGSDLGLNRDRELMLVKALQGLQGRATLGDVVRVTGLPRGELEVQLRELLGLYRSHLEVDEEGELVYLFEPSFVRRIPEPTMQDMARKLWRWSLKAAKWSFKVSVMVMLVSYVILFCVIIVAAVIALAVATEGDVDLDLPDADVDAGCLGGMLDTMTFWHVGDVLYVPLVIYDDLESERKMTAVPAAFQEPRALEPRYVTDRYGLRRGKKKRFYEEVFAVLFGPEVPEPPLLAEEKEILAWIESHRGVITRTELISRTGLSVDEAEQELARLMARYEGGVEVDENGEILYTFRDLRVTAQKKGRLTEEIRPAPPAWHRFEPAKEVIGNSGGKNVLIYAMTTFTLVMSVLTPGLAQLGETGISPLVFAGLGVVPFLMSLSFFVAPLIRSYAVFKENKRRKKRNLRRAALLVLFEHLATGEDFTRAEAIVRVQRHLGELQDCLSGDEDRKTMKKLEEAEPQDIGAALDELLVEMEADFEVREDGKQVISFPGLQGELDAAARARSRESRDAVSVKEIVYSSAEDEHDDTLADEIEGLAMPEEAEVHANAEVVEAEAWKKR